jgi:peptidoglycan/xylan/chitin deacetylase (PgdA/CDA1 family)
VFTATEPFLLLDYFRAPYVVEAGDGPLQAVRSDETRRALLYPRNAGLPHAWELGSIRLFVGAADEAEMQSWLGEGWSPAERLQTPDGAATTAIWRSDEGGVAFPFDPNEAIASFWSESYQSGNPRAAGVAKAALRRAYYRARPLLPRRTQIALRRGFSRVQQRSAFPRWPVETSLHDLFDLLFAELRQVAGKPVPTLAPWPAGREWTLVLTHDVETDVGASNVGLLRGIEEGRGFRSSWNFVPHRYEVADELVRELEDNGFEVGVHGLKHDGRDLESLQTLERRLPEIRRYAERWRATGFRSPATHRRWEWMPLLGFDYDSSYPDTDPYEPQAGGCCSWLPFFNGELVELPITLPQDYTLFTILRVEDERPWLEKATYLRDRGGMALMITHPDYMLEQRHLDVYARLLDELGADETLWRALPREVSAWWRRRAESAVVRNGSGWVVEGPAAGEAAVVEH